MANEQSSSILFLSVLVLVLVISPTLQCQAARVHLDDKLIFLN
ncbi:unnamed protein product [Arabidopsis thaliana]|uniref:Transmembrane protein n=1 Tax=Arabidopsis thaliana TaxID=3702 RepID=A0A5S9WLH1_ARATH|nr:unnamed protein product [Arabidopsis thaliana]